MIAFRMVTMLAGAAGIAAMMVYGIGCEHGGASASDRPPPDDIVYRYGNWSTWAVHDDKRHVTCWKSSDSISCLPDWFIDYAVDGGTK